MYLNVEKKNSKSYQDRHLSFFTPYNSPHKLKLCTFCAPIPLMLCYKRPVRAVLKIFSTACVKNNILYVLQISLAELFHISNQWNTRNYFRLPIAHNEEAKVVFLPGLELCQRWRPSPPGPPDPQL